MPKNFVYSDVDKSMRIDASGNVRILYDEDVIIQSIKILFATISGERVRTLLGSRLVFLLGRPFGEITTDLLVQETRSIIERYEPRVRVINIDLFPRPDYNIYDLRLTLELRDLGRRIEFNTSLRRF